MAIEVKNPPANEGDIRDTGSISRWGRSPGGGNDNPLQSSCLENLMDRGAIGSIGSQRIGHDYIFKRKTKFPGL